MRTYRLAICEDDEEIREKIGRLCDEILTESRIDHTLTFFAGAEEAGAAIREPRRFDVLILDIRLEHMTGMELAKELRREDNRISIIFITGYEEYLREGYEVQPVHFLLKPIDRERLKEALLTDWRLNHKPRSVTLQKGHHTLRLLLEEIFYVESAGNHSVKIALKEGEEMFPITLSEMGRLLPTGGQFIRCHNSYLVNMGHIREWKGAVLQMGNGENLPVGRKYYKECQAAFISYINR